MAAIRVPGARRARAGMEVYRMDIVADLLRAPGTDSESAGRNAAPSMTSGAPTTTSGAPRAAQSIACWIDKPPTACTGHRHRADDRVDFVERAQSLDQVALVEADVMDDDVHAELSSHRRARDAVGARRGCLPSP